MGVAAVALNLFAAHNELINAWRQKKKKILQLHLTKVVYAAIDGDYGGVTAKLDNCVSSEDSMPSSDFISKFYRLASIKCQKPAGDIAEL